MLTLSEVKYLRDTPPDELIDAYGGFCRDSYEPNGTPVVVAACNERRDLPATLLAIALSDIDVMAVVVENGSEDDTAETAAKMGAIVLRAETAAKMGALQLGTKFALQELGTRDVLYTDADTLVGHSWAGTLHGKLDSPDDLPVIVSAPSVFRHGGTPIAELMRSGRSYILNAQAAALRTPPAMSGHNMALHFDGEERLYEKYQALRPELFIGEERAMLDAVITLGGIARTSLSLSAITVTRGDRVPTLLDCFKLFRSTAYRETLYGDYPSADLFVRYTGANAFAAVIDGSSARTAD